jgi:hypothetical protein
MRTEAITIFLLAVLTITAAPVHQIQGPPVGIRPLAPIGRQTGTQLIPQVPEPSQGEVNAGIDRHRTGAPMKDPNSVTDFIYTDYGDGVGGF